MESGVTLEPFLRHLGSVTVGLPESESPLGHFNNCQGQVSAEGILHLVNPNLGSNSGMRIFEPRILGPNSGVEFFGPMFPIKRAPSKIHPQEIHRPNSHQKFAPEFGLKNSHFCRAILLNNCFCVST